MTHKAIVAFQHAHGRRDRFIPHGPGKTVHDGFVPLGRAIVAAAGCLEGLQFLAKKAVHRAYGLPCAQEEGLPYSLHERRTFHNRHFTALVRKQQVAVGGDWQLLQQQKRLFDAGGFFQQIPHGKAGVQSRPDLLEARRHKGHAHSQTMLCLLYTSRCV